MPPPPQTKQAEKFVPAPADLDDYFVCEFQNVNKQSRLSIPKPMLTGRLFSK